MALLTGPPSGGALAPYRVLDLTGELGAFCGKLLADLGAEVIKIEPPDGDAARRLGPYKDGIPHQEGSLRFASLNVNKKGLSLSLDSQRGRDIFQRLIDSADVLIEDRPPGELAGLGLADDELRGRNPGLIHTSITGFGLEGPHRQYKAPDLVGLAMGGILNLSGDPGLPPCAAPETQSYYVACLHAAFATVAALLARGMGAPGQLVEISAQDCLMVQEHQVSRYGQDGHIVGREGNQHGSAAPGAVFPVQDGFAHIFVANTWPEFLDWMGNPEPLTDDAWEQGSFRRANVDLLNPFVREFARGFTRDRIADAGQARRTPVVPVNRPEDVAEDEHMKAIGFFYQGEHAHLGPARYAGAPYQMGATPPRLERTAPLLGEHNVDILTGLGISPDELAVLRANRVI